MILKLNEKKNKVIYFTFLLLSISFYNCNATDWYASPTGTGNGSFSNPFNLQTALNSSNILPGDNLWLRGGTYHGRFISYLSGTATAKITVASYSGEWAVLDGNILPSTSTDTQVLRVLGGFVRYKDFEITYSDVIRSDATTNYALCGGIEHYDGEDCEFINLSIHDTPGKGVGSWKETGGTIFYGCIIYNNGYLTPSLDTRGHGPGLYIQNSSEKFRIFKNNIVFNNFHDGFECFSATSTNESTPEYHKNITFDDNVAFNNGSPHLVPDPDDGIIRSFGDNNINVSNYSSDGSNKIRNINITNNVLYHNTDYSNPLLGTSGETCSLLIGNAYPCVPPLVDPGNGSENILVKNNFISGKNNHINLKNINTITFEDNSCLGRYIIVDENNREYGRINPYNWKFNNNTYYSYNGNIGYCNPPGAYVVFRMTHVEYDTNCHLLDTPITNTDYFVYNNSHTATNCTGGGGVVYNDWPVIFSIDSDSKWRFFELSKNPSRCGGNSHGPWDNPPKVLSLTQNQYKLNQYKLALLFDPGKYPRSALNDGCNVTYQPSNPLVTVDFSNYNINIPDGTTYIIRDVENLSSTTPISGTITGNQITFDLSTTGFDPPQGMDFTNFSEKTPDNFGVFLIEFANFTGCVANKEVSTAYPSGFLDFEQASNTITASSIVNNGSITIYHAGSSVVLTDGFYAKNGSRFRGYIEGCSQSFVGRVMNPDSKNEEREVNNLKEEEYSESMLLISPNPNSGVFNIKVLKKKKIKQVTIREINNAKILFEKKYEGDKEVNIDISNQSQGLYTVNVIFDDNSNEVKTIIKK